MKTRISALEMIAAAIQNRFKTRGQTAGQVKTDVDILENIAKSIDGGADGQSSRVVPLTDDAELASSVIEAVGIPTYIEDLTQYEDFGLTDTGWYILARVTPPSGSSVTAATSVEGVAGSIIEPGADHIDVAVRFPVAAYSQKVTVNWGATTETFIFKATDLAVRNLDYRVTFYVYDAAPFVTWEYALTTDTTFAADKNYYVKGAENVYTPAEVTVGDVVIALYEQVEAYALTTDTTFQDGTTYYTKDGDTYTEATVTAGEAVTADTYYVLTTSYVRTTDGTVQEGKTYYTFAENVYTPAEVTVGDVAAYFNHSKVIIQGLTRNVTYRLDDIVDCPMEFILPEIEDETYGAWFEIRCRHAGEYSMTLVPPASDIKIATEHTQKETAGFNTIDLHYTVIDGEKLWRFLNTHSSIPTT